MNEETKEGGKPLPRIDPDLFAGRLFGILDHQDNVRDVGRILLKGLVDEEEFDLALSLAHRLSQHDAGKFTYIEWFGMYSDNAEVKRMAIEHHRHTNAHHLPFHGNDPQNMADVDIAEWCCDIKARSEEFGSSVQDFVKRFAEERGIKPHSYFLKKATHYFNLILKPPFKAI